MKEKSIVMRIAVCSALVALGLAITSCAVKRPPDRTVHDTNPELLPPVITPAAQPGQPPPDAIILFNGTDLKENGTGLKEWASDKGEAKWKLENDYMEVNKTGSIHTKKSFGSCQLHIEWASPAPPKGKGQHRGNSGVFFMGKYELQILDSYNNRTYADGQAASIYGQYPPLVNVCHKPGQWQSFDVSFLRPIFDEAGKCIRPARITVFHNGVVVHNNVEIWGTTAHKVKNPKYSRHPAKLPLGLQDHGDLVKYRNIWIRELPEQPYLIAD